MKTLIYKQPPNHPNVVPIMGISLDGGQCVMSALALGGSLESRRVRSRVSRHCTPREWCTET
jgi:hypothetical protein